MSAPSDHQRPPHAHAPHAEDAVHVDPLRDDQATRLRAIAERAEHNTNHGAPAVAPGRGAAPGTPEPAHTAETQADASSGTPAPARRAPIIAIASGKGGVGKTTIAVTLAAHLAQHGLETTLLDGDLGLANADVLLGINARLHLGHVLAGEHTLDHVRVPTDLGFTLVPGGSGIDALADLSALERQTLSETAHDLARSCDALLIDCGAGIGRSVRALLTLADTVVVVTTPDPAAIADAYGLIKCCVRMRARTSVEPGLQPHMQRAAQKLSTDDAQAAWSSQHPLALVVNQATSAKQAQDVHARIANVCDRFLGAKLPMLGSIATDHAVRKAALARTTIARSAPKSRFCKDIRGVFGPLGASLGRNAPCDAPRARVLARFMR